MTNFFCHFYLHAAYFFVRREQKSRKIVCFLLTAGDVNVVDNITAAFSQVWNACTRSYLIDRLPG